MTKPLELLGGRTPTDTTRVRFNSEGMRTHEITAKLQALSIHPLRQQIVVDTIPGVMLTGRQDLAKKLKLDPRPIAYLRIGPEDGSDLEKFLKMVFVAYLAHAHDGHIVSLEQLSLEVKERAKDLAGDIAYATQDVLRRITEAREGILAPATEAPA